MSNVDARMSELRQHATELSQSAQQLPGRSTADDRKLVADAFAKASSSLELLGGPQPGGAFRQQLRIIENTRSFLASPSTASVAPDPSVDTGLRSMENALTSVRERLFPDDPKIKGEIDALRSRLGELDTVRGPIHSLIVAQAFVSAANVVNTMAGELDARNTAQQQATEPSPAPSAPSAGRAPSAPGAVPAAASTPPAPSRPYAAPSAPAAPVPPAPPVPPSAAAAPSAPPPHSSAQQPTQQQYQELQRKYDELQRQVEQLRQQQQQQNPAAPAR
jgi:hypothetical protein